MTVPPFEPPHRACPEHPAISAYRNALPEGEVLAYPLDPLDHLGLPVWSAELFSASGAMHHGVGYGASDERAVTGAFGELSETLFAGDAIERLEKRRASFEELLALAWREGVALEENVPAAAALRAAGYDLLFANHAVQPVP